MTSMKFGNAEFKVLFSRKLKELLKWNKKYPSLTSALSFFRLRKQTSKNVVDTTFNVLFDYHYYTKIVYYALLGKALVLLSFVVLLSLTDITKISGMTHLKGINFSDNTNQINYNILAE